MKASDSLIFHFEGFTNLILSVLKPCRPYFFHPKAAAKIVVINSIPYKIHRVYSVLVNGTVFVLYVISRAMRDFLDSGSFINFEYYNNFIKGAARLYFVM